MVIRIKNTVNFAAYIEDPPSGVYEIPIVHGYTGTVTIQFLADIGRLDREQDFPGIFRLARHDVFKFTLEKPVTHIPAGPTLPIPPPRIIEAP